MRTVIDEWMNDLPSQFQGKKNIDVLLNAFSRQLQEVQQMFADLYEKTDLDVATGQNLDYVGTIIPLTRKEAGELAGIGVTDPVISDDRYRQFLRYKNLVNTNECTYYDLMDGLALLWDVSPIYYIEDPDLPATIILTMPFLEPGGEAIPLGEVPMVKSAGVRIEFEYRIKVVVEVLCRWICSAYKVPLCNQLLCGQHPRRGSLGKIIYIETDIDLEEIIRIFNHTMTGTIRVGGKLYDSTTGEVITEGVEIEINSDFRITEVKLCGQVITGTYPIRSVNGVMMGTSAEAGKIITNSKTSLPLTGTLTSGGGVMEEPASNRLGNDIGVFSSVHVAAADAPLCGTINAKEPEAAVISELVAAEPTISIVPVSVRRCGTAVCGNKR